ncbi:MAG TPA: hypothetical protein VKS82_20750 [Streptosporangiaceae bacterium]|nr:hypothetical protein [Streptosporangiaceae bacterium]
MLYGIAAVSLAGVSAAIGAVASRLYTRTSEGDREPSPSNAKITISLLPYEFSEPVEAPSPAAALLIMLLPDEHH